MNYWKTLSEALARAGFSATLISQLKKQFQGVDIEDVGHIPAADLAAQVAAAGGSISAAQVATLQKLARAVFERLDTDFRSLAPAGPKEGVFEVMLLLRDAESPGRPVGYLDVQIERPGDGNQPDEVLFTGRTDASGAVRFPVPAALASTSVRVRVSGLDGEKILIENATPSKDKPQLALDLKLSKYRTRIAAPLDDWQKALGKALAPKLAELYKNEKASTLTDLRRLADKLRKAPGLSSADQKAQDELLAHAGLQVLSRDHRLNQSLVDAGYTSIFAVASVSRAAFVAALKGKLDEQAAARLHEQAGYKLEVAKNQALERKVAQANGFAQAAANEEQPCNCDCQSAVSPLAYLADLLDFVLREVRYDDNALTLAQLEALFHQPFAAMPADCSASQEVVRQVRICIEVLRREALARNIDLSTRADIAGLPRRAYEALLAALGTSSRELRLLRGAPDKHRERKAAALGIDVARLNDLWLDETALSEAAIEKLFGWPDTTRDPLLPGPMPQLLTWQQDKLAGQWLAEDHPMGVYNLGATPKIPIIDPDLLTEDDFCRPLGDNQAHQLWKTRKQELDDGYQEIDKKSAGVQRTFLEMLGRVWPANPPAWDAIAADLNSKDEAKVQARLRELARLHLAPEAFAFLQALRLQATASTPVEPADTAREQALHILVNVSKRRDDYDKWRDDEAQAGIGLSWRFFCSSRAEPALNPLRVSAEERARWAGELEGNSQAPIIDPDLLPSAGRELASSLWAGRYDQLKKVEDTFEALLSAGSLDRAWLDERLATRDLTSAGGILLHQLGLTDLESLQQRFDTDKVIDIPPQQHGLTGRELAALLAMRKLVKSGLADEQDWRDIFHVLIQAEKRRYLYPLWREEEAAQQLTLSPEFFVDPDRPLLAQVPATDRSPGFDEWRANPGALRTWQVLLKSRYRQQAALVEGLRAAVDRAEESSLPALRDALVGILGNPAVSHEQNKKDLVNALLINTFESECRKTTRVAQAIETLQLLVWGLLNGQLEDPKFSLPGQNQAAFQASWRWLQFYGFWRAAMFTFLYPENFLMPELRDKQIQTPLFKAIFKLINDGPPPASTNSDGAPPPVEPDPLTEALMAQLGDVNPSSLAGLRLIYQALRTLRLEVSGDAMVVSDLTLAGPLPGPLYFLGWTFLRADGSRGQERATRLCIYFGNEAFLEDRAYIPLLFGIFLQKQGLFEEALDFFQFVSGGAFALVETGQSSSDTLRIQEDWLQDPLNPHAVARTRPPVNKRGVSILKIRCLLDYAEAEFSADTPESLARARELYFTAQHLLERPELQQYLPDCDGSIGNLIVEVGEKYRDRPDLRNVIIDGLLDAAPQITLELIPGILDDLDKIVRGPRPLPNIHRDLETLWSLYTPDPTPAALGARLNRIGLAQDQILREQLKNADAFDLLQQVGNGFADGAQPRRLFSAANLPRRLLGPGDLVKVDDRIKIPGVSFAFCIPPNPILIGLRLRVETGLFKLSHCMNLAGLRREILVYAAPTDTRGGLPGIGVSGAITLPQTVRLQSTQYRYKVLVERAKQLVGIAQQLEGSYLSFLERFDQETYGILKARQDLQMSNANVTLQGLRVTEADRGKYLANLQRDRAEIAFIHYETLINEGDNDLEKQSIEWLYQSIDLLRVSASLTTGYAIAVGLVAKAMLLSSGGVAGWSELGNSVSSFASAASAQASVLSSESSIAAMRASFERRRQEWEFQRFLADSDRMITDMQISLADDRFNIVKQEETIARIGANHAEDVLNFLNTKFTNADLFGWMSGIVGSVYRYFLQQAASIAKLAQMQLAFERQEAGLDFILSDYWSVTMNGNAVNSENTDRRGLTGSARLLQDIYRMDQHAFTTDRRKLQMSKTISLAAHDPIAFEQFRQTGVLPFGTTLELFDRDFPGHYLRLIKRVRTSVIALIPPTHGIKATLSNLGISRVVASMEGGALFEERDIRREPESVALTAPIGDSGVFELQDQPEMLLPFEGTGVAGSWEFRLPQAANLFDFSSIADVLVTIEYTALDSSTYRQQVVQRLDRQISIDRPFSFRQQFADAWYDLHQPDLAQQPMVVSFTTRREDFPPNVTDLQIEHVTLFVARKSGVTDEIDIQHLHVVQPGRAGTLGGPASTIDGIAGTRQGNAGSWRAMIGKSPVGEWTLAFTDHEATRQLFACDQIEDVLFVLTVGGTTPAWPNES